MIDGAFHSDSFALDTANALIKKHGCKTLIETGTYSGNTTAWLASFGLPVYSIEIDSSLVNAARVRFSGAKNVSILEGDSAKVLGTLLPTIKLPVFAFLDAHWYDHWPLKDELGWFSTHGIKPILMLHDFFVPGTDLGYDEYKGQKLDLDYVWPELVAIYGEPVHWFVNHESSGAKRGILYVEP